MQSNISSFLNNDRFRLFVVLLVLLLAFMYFQKNKFQALQQRAVKPDTKNVTPTPSPLITAQPSTEQSAEPTNTPTYIPTSTPMEEENSSFIYPRSRTVSRLGDTIVLETSDTPNTVTEWYKQKVKSIGMNATSFVTTSTNGNVLNKLVAANSTQKINVEIKKSAQVPTVTITVTTSSS